MENTPLTPDQKKAIAKNYTIQACKQLADFVELHKVNKTYLANAIGINQQNISKILSGDRMCRLDTLILIQLGLEALTGAKFERPTFTRQAMAVKRFEK